MASYIVRRFLIAIPILFGLSLMTFGLTQAMPGDYVDAMIPPEVAARSTPEQLAAARENLGLNESLPRQYLTWLGEVGRGNLGYSLSSGEPVTKEILHRLPTTLSLTLAALLFGVIVGSILGIVSAYRQYSWIDQLLTVLGFIWISTPGFVFAIGAIVIFSLKLSLFPTSGIASYGEGGGLIDRAYHLVLPATVLGLSEVAVYMRYVRSSTLDVINQDYVTIARAKGLTEQKIMVRHTLRNALIPMITILGMSLPGLLSGAIIIESVFAFPGMGSFSLSAISSRDYPAIMGINLVLAIAVLGSNLIADIAYGIVDPRVRLGSSA